MKKFEGPPTEHITRIRIPDDAAMDWMQTYRDAGFSTEQIEAVMTRLNDTYLKQRFGEFIDQELQDAIAEIERKKGKPVGEESREWLRGRLVEHMQKMNYDDLQQWVEQKKSQQR
ncbi:MAG: hypothetical protein AAB490_02575 [Patescibacteria group bacterium]